MIPPDYSNDDTDSIKNLAKFIPIDMHLPFARLPMMMCTTKLDRPNEAA